MTRQEVLDAIAANDTLTTAAPLACESAYLFRVRAHRSGDDAFSLYSDAVSSATANCLKLSLPLIRK